MQSNSNPDLVRYLRELRWALEPLPEVDRDEIVREVESHFAERLSQPDADFAIVAASFGKPHEYARSFLVNYEVTAVLASESVPRMMKTAMKSTSRRGPRLVGVFLLLQLYLVAFMLLVLAVVKPLLPETVGFWTGENEIFLGFNTTPAASDREWLGFWLVPICLAGAVLVFAATTRWLKRFVAGLREA